MVEIQGLSFSYGDDFRLAIEELSVRKGERLAVVGPSGSGKTTLLNLLAGILHPQQGTISVDGQAIHGMSSRQLRTFRLRRLGLVFQEFELIEYLNTLDNILLPYRLHSELSITSEVKQRAKSLAGRLEIGDKLSRFPANLSQGERQRVAICRAVIGSPSLLLADEPTGNLDPLNKHQVLDLLMSVVEQIGSTLITVTHDHGLLERFDRVIDFDIFLKPAAKSKLTGSIEESQK